MLRKLRLLQVGITMAMLILTTLFMPIAFYLLYVVEILTFYADQSEIASTHLRALPWLTAAMGMIFVICSICSIGYMLRFNALLQEHRKQGE